ncbi:MAG: hypothetical protein A3C88_01935 [Candidatus Yanofskybacteria bacterium RIFCSPHIGHO2_02_FULL_50_12]|uniref:EfeO-type cupredoxin-like domain-containing protein n=1 Tax=Candidatus Yanofskybacteria bacterium RIFCSPHIGHO2_02_FULL_50_12 TaxID=1802685 RepID=A0A1F8FV14_9BACT|nr:MAG: hypothetical protein A3C88_01935 [Candidatus Yanofskybacteria bacterium RIFCSPHIGHO2_02_FULL_50_12]
MEELEPTLASKEDRPSFRAANEPGISWLLIIFFLMLMAVAILIFGKSQPPLAQVSPTATPFPTSTGQARMYTVSYDAGVFSPTNLRIHAGDTVRFKNESIFPIRIVSEDLVGFDSVGDVPQGSYFSYTFAGRGTFSYYNSHNADQGGTIIVR